MEELVIDHNKEHNEEAKQKVDRAVWQMDYPARAMWIKELTQIKVGFKRRVRTRSGAMRRLW